MTTNTVVEFDEGTGGITKIVFRDHTVENGASGKNLAVEETLLELTQTMVSGLGTTFDVYIKGELAKVGLGTWITGGSAKKFLAGGAAGVDFAIEVRKLELAGVTNYEARVKLAGAIVGQSVAVQSVGQAYGVASGLAMGGPVGGILLGMAGASLAAFVYDKVWGDDWRQEMLDDYFAKLKGITGASIPANGTELKDSINGDKLAQYFEDGISADNSYIYSNPEKTFIISESINGGTDTLSFQSLSQGIIAIMDNPSIHQFGEAILIGDTSGQPKAIFEYIEQIIGTESNDLVFGRDDSVHGDTIIAIGGNDGIRGRDGADSISGGSGNDTLLGGDGADTLIGGSGDNTLAGGEGGDKLIAYIDPSDQSYPIESVTTTDRMYGDAGDDTLIAGPGTEVMMGGAGNDRYEFNGYFGHDFVQDTDGNGGIFINGVQITSLQHGMRSWAVGDMIQGPVGISGYYYNITLVPGEPAKDHLIISGPDGAIMLGDWNSGDYGIVTPTFTQLDHLTHNTYFDNWYDTHIPYYHLLYSSIMPLVVDDSAPSVNWGVEGIYDEAADTAIDPSNFGTTAPTYNSGTSSGDSITGSTTTPNLTYGMGGNDTMQGQSLEDSLFGGDGNDSLTGSGSDDLLSGDAGTDTLIGGAGDDTYIVKTGDTVTESASEGTDTVRTQSSGLTLGSHLENLVLLGTGNLNGTGNTLANILTGNSGNNALSSGGDNDVLEGSDGSDTLSGETGNDTLYGGNGTDSLSGGDGDDSIYGEAGNDTAVGSVGSDFIHLGADSDLFTSAFEDIATSDTIDGGIGTDSFTVTSSTVAVTLDLVTNAHVRGFEVMTVLANSSNVTVGSAYFDDASFTGDLLTFSAASSTFRAKFDASAVTGTDRVLLTGSVSATGDTLTGGAGNDTIAGLSGSDSLTGSGGFDIVSYLASGVAVSVNLATASVSGGDAAGDILAGFEGVIGSAYNDTLTGSASTDSLEGSAGNDSLAGAAGIDTLSGGNGADTLFGGTEGDLLWGGADGDSLYGEAGNDSLNGEAGADMLAGGDGADSLNGNEDSDTLWGGNNNDTLAGSDGNDSVYGEAGSDVLWGGIGADSLHGGTEGDTLWGEAGNDTLAGDYGDDSMHGGTENDELWAGDGNDTLTGGDGNDVEHGGNGTDTLYGSNGDDVLYGDNDADYVSGGMNNDTLYGGGGADSLYGDGGNDSVWGDDGNDTLFGSNGADTVDGRNDNDVIYGNLGGAPTDTDGADLLIGNAGTDTLYGEAGNDALDGGAGADALYGGNGADTFRWWSSSESGIGTGNVDVIHDFSTAQGDKINVSALAGTFTLIGSNPFSATQNEIRITTASGNSTLAFDADANGSTDFEILVIGVTNLVASDFVL